MNDFIYLGMIGGQEWIWIFVVLLLLFGAKKLPELARGIGKSLGEFKKAREEFEHEITTAETESKSSSSKSAATENKVVENDKA